MISPTGDLRDADDFAAHDLVEAHEYHLAVLLQAELRTGTIRTHPFTIGDFKPFETFGIERVTSRFALSHEPDIHHHSRHFRQRRTPLHADAALLIPLYRAGWFP